jgi:hypothetical protein
MRLPDDPREIADYLRRQNADHHRGVLRVLDDAGGSYRGKVNLGRAAGARVTPARSVESAVRLGLVLQAWDHGAFLHTISHLGRQVLAIADGD